jgi:hypothetical protein
MRDQIGDDFCSGKANFRQGLTKGLLFCLL